IGPFCFLQRQGPDPHGFPRAPSAGNPRGRPTAPGGGTPPPLGKLVGGEGGAPRVLESPRREKTGPFFFLAGGGGPRALSPPRHARGPHGRAHTARRSNPRPFLGNGCGSVGRARLYVVGPRSKDSGLFVFYSGRGVTRTVSHARHRREPPASGQR